MTLALLLLVALTVLPAASPPSCCASPPSQARVEVGGGLFVDPYDAGEDLEGGGPMGVLRIGYAVRPDLGLTLGAALAASYDIANAGDLSPSGRPTPMIDARWTIITLGAVRDLTGGSTGILLGVEGGVAFRTLSTRSPDSADITGGFDGGGMTFGYRIGLRQRLSPHADAVLAVRDALLHVTDGFNSRSLGVTLSLLIH